MTIEDIYRKLKEKNSDYVVTEDQWGLAFTIYYKVATPVNGQEKINHKLFHVEWDEYGNSWVISTEEINYLQSQTDIVTYPLLLLKKLNEPICTDRMPLLDGFNGEKEVKNGKER